jgi:hypothetical protein
MKQKKETFYSTRIKGFVVFRNDIEEALNILTDNGLSITLQDDNHFYDNIDEIIRNVGNRPKKLKIEARNKETYESVGLTFDKNELSINCHGSEQMYSLGFRLKNYFSKTIPWHYKVFNPWFFYFTTITPLFTITLAFDNTTNELERPWVLVLFAISFLMILFSYLLRKNVYGIRLVKSHEHGFWKRNKDSLIVTLISTIVGAVLGVIGTLLVQHFSK